MPCLDSLPAELLLQICSYIDHTHRPSLSSLSIVNKTLLKPCTAQLFRTIHIHVSSPKACQKSIQQWNRLLARRNCRNDVRFVEIHGFLANEEDQASFQDCQYCQGLFDDECGVESHVHDHSGGFSVEAENEAFTPIAAYLKELPSATDLIWRCHNFVPQCILDATNATKPPLRLHVHDFKLLHLDSNEIGRRELAILQSPSLHSMTVRYLGSEINGVYSTVKPRRAISKLLVGFSPNLKQLRLMSCQDKILPYRKEDRRDLDQLCSEAGTTRLARLERFDLRPSTVVDSDDIRTWHELLDPAWLRCLHLGAALSTPTIRWASRNAHFENLQKLIFSFDNPDYPQEERSARADDTQTWLLSLPRLRVLGLSGPLYREYAQAIRSALGWHGQTLEKFVLGPPLYGKNNHSDARETIDAGMEMLVDLSRTCPVLQELSIPLRRSRSNRTEIELYQYLAEFPNLTKISLQFDCCCWGLMVVDGESDLSPEDREPWFTHTPIDSENVTTGRVRRAMIKAALDESLVRSGTDGDKNQDIDNDIWTCLPYFESSNEHGPEMKLFREIWPETAPGSDWRDDWHSFPLDAAA
ncbi:hypothetical protein M409DRAFT_59705 [Zasmidium cellare ATCC 36951]|uniref:C2H2-type domain-containing protein n=1 Tax=Zasmidium cellare ATCC 36951 TaxID=1080233 RepID=A0A6A6C5K5_ZASCE|nr:uncharacterized protein M409DRAFT_59705 [Zasmidium cellare ATCC 36951]KAF2160666.1 hypothetical protein M409DRAFT_59705 [Zasmidium cellare ATCC 36951]